MSSQDYDNYLNQAQAGTSRLQQFAQQREMEGTAMYSAVAGSFDTRAGLEASEEKKEEEQGGATLGGGVLTGKLFEAGKTRFIKRAQRLAGEKIQGIVDNYRKNLPARNQPEIDFDNIDRSNIRDLKSSLQERADNLPTEAQNEVTAKTQADPNFTAKPKNLDEFKTNYKIVDNNLREQETDLNVKPNDPQFKTSFDNTRPTQTTTTTTQTRAGGDQTNLGGADADTDLGTQTRLGTTTITQNVADNPTAQLGRSELKATGEQMKILGDKLGVDTGDLTGEELGGAIGDALGDRVGAKVLSSVAGEGLGALASGLLDFIPIAGDIAGTYLMFKGAGEGTSEEDTLQQKRNVLSGDINQLADTPAFTAGNVSAPTFDSSQLRVGGMENF